MANIINPSFLSLPQQVQKNKEDILKILASKIKELTGLQFVPTGVVYQENTAVLNGKFIVIREGDEAEIEGVVQLPLIGDNGINIDASEDDLNVRISLDQSDRELLNFVEELVEATSDDNHIVFTNDMTTFVNSSIATAIEGVEKVETIYDSNSNDIALNWGYTSGIPNNSHISGKDFSKYKKLRCYLGWKTTSDGGSFEIDLNNAVNNGNNYDGGSVFTTFWENVLHFRWGKVSVSSSKNDFYYKGGTIATSNYSSPYENLLKIEGVY